MDTMRFRQGRVWEKTWFNRVPGQLNVASIPPTADLGFYPRAATDCVVRMTRMNPNLSVRR
jgi:hypothetical protein